MIKYPPSKLMLLILVVSSILACRKSSPEKEEGPESPLTGTRQELTRDSLYLYIRHTYLWNDAVPDYTAFSPRKYTGASSELLNLKHELFELGSLMKNPQTGQPYEETNMPGLLKYSYLEQGSPNNGYLAAAAEATNAASPVSLISGNTGYLKIRQFAHLNDLSSPLSSIFTTFTSASVHTLIVDLRNNPGGYVETAQYLANLIATPAMTSKVMYSQHFNTKMQQGKVPILKNQPYLDQNDQPVYISGRLATYADVDYTVSGNTCLFKKEGHLNSLQKIYFLVNDKTASASELLINVLRPYFDITLIGSRTYGKPLGSFAIKIDHYTLHAISFQIFNAENQGGYFDGMPPDLPAADEQLDAGPGTVLANTLALLQVQHAGKKALGYQIRQDRNSIPYTGNQKAVFQPEMIKDRLRLKQPADRPDPKPDNN